MKPCQGSLFNIGEQEVEQFTWVNDKPKKSKQTQGNCLLLCHGSSKRILHPSKVLRITKSVNKISRLFRLQPAGQKE